MKSLFASRVFWVAIIQACVGSVVIFQQAYPQAGFLLVVKSALDIILRIYTYKAIS